jgi:hypothetical protein
MLGYVFFEGVDDFPVDARERGVPDYFAFGLRSFE